MPEMKPAGLPDAPLDPALFNVPVNGRPEIAWPEPTPADPDRERVVTEGATHVVISDRFGVWSRGDKIKEAGLPASAVLANILKIKPYPPIRLLRDDEKPTKDEITQFDPTPPKVAEPVKPVDPPKPPAK